MPQSGAVHKRSDYKSQCCAQAQRSVLFPARAIGDAAYPSPEEMPDPELLEVEELSPSCSFISARICGRYLERTFLHLVPSGIPSRTVKKLWPNLHPRHVVQFSGILATP